LRDLQESGAMGQVTRGRAWAGYVKGGSHLDHQHWLLGWFSGAMGATTRHLDPWRLRKMGRGSIFGAGVATPGLGVYGGEREWYGVVWWKVVW